MSVLNFLLWVLFSELSQVVFVVYCLSEIFYFWSFLLLPCYNLYHRIQSKGSSSGTPFLSTCLLNLSVIRDISSRSIVPFVFSPLFFRYGPTSESISGRLYRNRTRTSSCDLIQLESQRVPFLRLNDMRMKTLGDQFPTHLPHLRVPEDLKTYTPIFWRCLFHCKSFFSVPTLNGLLSVLTKVWTNKKEPREIKTGPEYLRRYTYFYYNFKMGRISTGVTLWTIPFD